MRHIPMIILAAVVFLAAGCMPSYDRTQLLHYLTEQGVEESSVRLHSPTLFFVRSISSPVQTRSEMGIFVLTYDGVFLITPNGPDGTYALRLNLLYSEIAAVAMYSLGLHRQLQIFTKSTKVGIELSRPGIFFVDRDLMVHSFSLIKQKGIKEREPTAPMLNNVFIFVPS
jgi:hypothetical protein